MDINYIRSGNYYIPDLTLPEEPRPMGKWGRMHREYLKEHKPIQYNCLLLSGELWTYLADLNEQAQDRLERMIDRMKAVEGITEALKASDPMVWVQSMNNIRARAEEIILQELIYGEDAT
ncbi:MAG: TnpV protein [Clostridiales bacterium]|nr:TnpV protein [Clostridiales bacterium]